MESSFIHRAVSLACLPHSFETKSHSEPGAHHLARLAGEETPGILLFLPPHMPSLGSFKIVLNIWVQRLWDQVFMLVWRYLSDRGFSSAPFYLFLMCLGSNSGSLPNQASALSTTELHRQPWSWHYFCQHMCPLGTMKIKNPFLLWKPKVAHILWWTLCAGFSKRFIQYHQLLVSFNSV